MRALLLGAAALAACGDGSGDGPFDNLTLDGSFTVGLEAEVDVARDIHGVAHIRGANIRDVAFVQGYVTAHDRLPQMDILRRFGAGTLGELFGALDASVIDTDLEMRMHRMKPLAQQSWDMLQASSDPTDRQLVDLLQRYADGVNKYAADLVAGTWTLDPEVLVSFAPDLFVPWSPVDSLVLGRFQAWALSYSADFEISLTEVYQKLQTAFSAPGPRQGIAADILTFTPAALSPTIPDFPNVTEDQGTSSDGSPRAGRSIASTRATVPDELFARARSFFREGVHTGALGALGPHAFKRPWAGSNNWAVSPEIAFERMALLASDQHLQLPNPSIFYPTHLTVVGDLDLLGITFPGIPGVILGSNGNVAWSATVSEHDANDVYQEDLAPCGATDCALFNGQRVPIETATEEIKVGALGTITETFLATYEFVPHHGPIIPAIENHRLKPRPAGPQQALSVRFTGYQPTFEIRALWRLGHATTVREGFEALSDFSFGSQNWTMIDSATDIGWTTNAIVPLRSAATYQWNATARPTAAAPFFVLPGTGAYEWEGRMPARYVPHAIAPHLPQPYLATANADPVGATFDGDPLNQAIIDGRPLYAGVSYAAGVREDRITKLIAQAPSPITPEDMARFQHDTRSNVGATMRPPILAALTYVADATGAPADTVVYLGTLPLGDAQRLLAMRDLLQGWTLATPVEGRDGAATALFNAWMHFFLEGVLKDELATAGFDLWRLGDNQLLRIANALFAPAPGHAFKTSATTQQPIVCDVLTEPGPDTSCTTMVLRAMVAAMKHLEGATGFGTADVAQWAWGRLHHLTIAPLFPNPALTLPRPGETATGGFAKAGDNFVVNRADHGWRDLDYAQFADGPAQRFLAIAPAPIGETRFPIRVRWQLPGGAIFDSRSPHYRDLLDKHYLAEQHFDAPFAVEEIVAAGEARWEFR
jgi:penicillin G amidase